MTTGQKSTLLSALTDCYEELVAFLTNKFGCPYLAEDVVQETWVRVQHLAPKTTIKQPRQYIFKMASNLAIDSLRSEKSRNRLVQGGDSIPESIQCASPLPETVTYDQQRLQILRQAIDELPARCREVFMLHKFDGLTHVEIADKLGITRNMVEKHVIRALAHCRGRLLAAMH